MRSWSKSEIRVDLRELGRGLEEVGVAKSSAEFVASDEGGGGALRAG